MTIVDITPLARHRRKDGKHKNFTSGDLKYLNWIKERDRAERQALPKISTKRRRTILAKMKEG